MTEEKRFRLNTVRSSRNNLKLIVIFFSVIAFILASSVYADHDTFDIEDESKMKFAADSIKQKSKDVAKQIEIYLKAYPEKSIQDLQNDSEFKEIAVQQVGKTGYTLLGDYKTLIVLMHKDPRFINFDTRNFKKINPLLWELVSAVQNGKDSYGFHPFEEKDGTVRDKFSYIAIIKEKTADGSNLFIAATTYLDEYIDAEEIIEESEDKKTILAKNQIKEKAISVAKQIEIFLKANPEKTLEDLQDDVFFKEIAVQRVGKTGYTAITDYDSLISRFHPNPKIVDLDLSNLKDTLSDFWEIMEKTKGGYGSEGFYDWKEEDGTINQKYMYIAVVNTRTADNIGLHVAATTYVDEYDDIFEEQKNSIINYFTIFILISSILIFFFAYLVGLPTKQDIQVRTYSIRKKLLGSFAIIVILMFGLIISTHIMNSQISKDLKGIENSEENLIKGIYEIKSYDSALTENSRSAVLHAMKGESDMVKKHQEEYNMVSGLLIASLEDEKRDLPLDGRIPDETRSVFIENNEEIKELNKILIDWQKESFMHINDNYTKKANSILMSEEYHQIEDRLSELYDKQADIENELISFYRHRVSQNFQKGETLNLIVGSICIMLVILISISMTVSILRPIKKLYSTTKELEKGNFSVRSDIKSGDELEQLGKTIDKVIEVLKNRDLEHRQLDHAKTEFLSITSHELRSPMTPMKAQLQMLLEGYFGKLNKKQKESIDIVLRNTTRLDKIILDFLEISRIEAARLKFRFVKAQLKEYIERLVEEMKGFMPEKNIEIITGIGKLPVIEVDPDRVMQILRNLINNAKKFSPDGSKIFLDAKLKDKMIVFSVRDQGIGISPQNQKRIFEPFFQEEQTMYREHSGTGLGLAICKGIVESQGGRMRIESKKGKGTTFYFTIPLTPVKEIKQIKVLFSEQKDIEDRVKEIFLEFLGPLGKSEFNRLNNKGLTYDSVKEYMGELEKKKIVRSDILKEVYEKLNSIFDIKKTIDITEEVRKVYVGILGPLGEGKFRKIKNLTENNIIRDINSLENKKVIDALEASNLRDQVIGIFAKKERSLQEQATEKRLAEFFREEDKTAGEAK